jgi:MATE family multidrug resistance protein
MNNVITRQLKSRWRGKGGYNEFLRVAIPLIVSTSVWTMQQFIDRMMLTWYSPSALAASMPEGILNFTLVCVFMGTASYAGTFIAQYYGAGMHKKIGPILWQGIYLALSGAGILVLCAFPAKTLFAVIGHNQAVQEQEVTFYSILCFGSAGPLLGSVLSSFYFGRNKNWTPVWINMIALIVNALLDYVLIFGIGPFPRMGITGAAYATVIASAVSALFFLFMIFSSANNNAYHTLSGWRFNTRLFLRLVRFGLPSGIQFFIDIAGITFFILCVGRIGTAELAASNIAFNINMFSFMPMIGCSIAVSMLVGQYVGDKNIPLAMRSVSSAFHITFTYMTLVACSFVLLPHVFLYPFASYADPASFEKIGSITVILLRFVALYSIFDTMTLIFSSAIKGAGDTKFVMYMISIVALFLLIIPTYLSIVVFKAGLYTSWIFVTLYISVLGLAFLMRYRNGAWKKMRVIEEFPDE